MTEPRKLAKNLENRKLSGVCAGIADYYSTDANLFRLVAILLAVFTGGAIVLAYIAAAFILPVRAEDRGKQGGTLLTIVFLIILIGALLSVTAI